jgi:hypothetical protein
MGDGPATAAGRLLASAAAVVLLAGSCSSTPDSARRDSRPPPRTSAGAVAGPAAAGIKWEWDNVDRYRAYLEGFGPGVTFYELVWCDIEPEAGKRDWRAVDQVVADATDLGFEMQLKIRVGSCWATGRRLDARGRKEKTASLFPSDLDAYRRFVAAVVGRYGPRGVHRYAVENEVNLTGFWQSNPADYERLVRAAAPVIHAADPGAVVLDGGISSTGSGVGIAARLLDERKGDAAVAAYRRYYARRFEAGRSQVPDVDSADRLAETLRGGVARRSLDYLDVTFRLAGDHVIDAYQLHFYERWDNVPALLEFLRSRLPDGFPIEGWETGLFWPGGDGNETELAGETAKVTSLLLAGGVLPVIWLPAMADTSDRGDEVRWGLFDASGGARPAAGVFQRLAAATARSTVSPLPGGAIQGVALSRDGRTVAVVWSEPGTRLAGPPPPGTEARSLDGNVRSWGAEGLPLTSDPVVVNVSGPLQAALEVIR